MKSWKARLGLVLTMLAMVLAVSIPAVADNDRDDIHRECFPFCNDRHDNDRDDFRLFCDDNDDCDRDDIRDLCDDFGDDGDCDIEELIDDCEDGDEEDCDFGDFDDLDFEVDNVELVCGDNDGDGSVDEDVVDGLDNDGDLQVDEDENFFECDNPLLVADLEIED